MCPVENDRGGEADCDGSGGTTVCFTEIWRRGKAVGVGFEDFQLYDVEVDCSGAAVCNGFTCFFIGTVQAEGGSDAVCNGLGGFIVSIRGAGVSWGEVGCVGLSGFIDFVE